MLEGGAQTTDAQSASGSTFVGRERDMRALVAGLDDAIAGRGRLLLIGGEPGIGKSRLADEFAAIARQRGCRTITGRAWEDAGAPAYWPWIQAFRAFLRGVDGEVVRRYLGIGAADLAQMLPEIESIAPGLDSPIASDAEAARFRLFDSAASFLINAARDVPLLVVLDDLHAADASSLLLLRFLAGQLGDSRVLVVATYRSLELTPDHPFTATLADLTREPAARLLSLEGLTESAGATLIDALAGTQLPPRVVAAIWRETSGNPLFLVEAIRFLSAMGGLERAADLGPLQLSVPARIRTVIRRRVALLDELTGRVLEYGAALGPEFSLEPLHHMAGEDALAVDAALERAMAAGLVIAVPGLRDRFRFSHALVRETLHAALDGAGRRALHRQIAQVLEAEYAGQVDEHLAELAYHFFETLPDGDAEKAVDYCRRAGDQATASLAYDEATRFYSMALQAHTTDRESTASAPAELLLLLGESQRRAGDLADSRASFLRAAASARQHHDPVRLARAALGYGGRFIWSRAGADTQLVPLMQDALAMLSGKDRALEVRLRGRIACAWRSSPEHFGDSDRLSAQALDMARQLDDPSTLCYALVGRFWATLWPDNPAQRLRIATELLAVAERQVDTERMIDGHQALYVGFVELGMIAEAKGQIAVVSRLAVELRQPPQGWAMRTYDTVLALSEGDFDRASALVDLETHSPEINTIRDDVSATRVHRFLLRREQARVGEEEANVRASAAQFPWYPFHQAALACLLLDIGRIDEARVTFEELARDDFGALYRDCEWLFGMSLASEACARLGNAAPAELLYRQLLPYAGRHAVAHAEGSLGAIDRYLGLLASVAGRPDDVVRHLEDAVTANERMGASPWAAHSRFDLAQALARRDGPGDARRAEELLHASRETAQRLGMAALLRRLSPAVEPAPGAVAVATPAGRRGVFRREGEYWTVGLDGQSARLRDAKGMRYLALLLARPGTEMHVLDIVGADGGSGPGGGVARAGQAVSRPQDWAMRVRSSMPRPVRPIASACGTLTPTLPRLRTGTTPSASRRSAPSASSSYVSSPQPSAWAVGRDSRHPPPSARD